MCLWYLFCCHERYLILFTGIFVIRFYSRSLAHTEIFVCSVQCEYAAQMMAHGLRMFIVCTWIFNCYAWFPFCANIYICPIQHLSILQIANIFETDFNWMLQNGKTVNPLTKQRHNINNNKRASNKLYSNWQSPLCSVVYVPMHLKIAAIIMKLCDYPLLEIHS